MRYRKSKVREWTRIDKPIAQPERMNGTSIKKSKKPANRGSWGLDFRMRGYAQRRRWTGMGRLISLSNTLRTQPLTWVWRGGGATTAHPQGLFDAYFL